MVSCENCGHTLSENYVRVCLPEDVEKVEMCPSCPRGDRIATNGVWRNQLNEPVNQGE